MPAFGASELEKLERLLKDVLDEARARRLRISRDAAARRLFDAAREGETRAAVLRAAALGPDNDADDDGPFPPAVGMRVTPAPEPRWPVPRLAA